MARATLLEQVIEGPEEAPAATPAEVEAAALWAEAAERLGAEPAPPPAPRPPKPPRQPASLEIMQMTQALASVLTVRVMLLCAVVGATVLAYRLLDTPTPYGLGVLAIYCVAMGPLVWLSARRM